VYTGAGAYLYLVCPYREFIVFFVICAAKFNLGIDLLWICVSFVRAAMFKLGMGPSCAVVFKLGMAYVRCCV
jgi:hypothetical protein